MSLPLAEATEPIWRGTPLCGDCDCLGQLLCLLAFPFASAFSTQQLREMLATQAQCPQKSADHPAEGLGVGDPLSCWVWLPEIILSSFC